jgi:hypothetical protein
MIRPARLPSIVAEFQRLLPGLRRSIAFPDQVEAVGVFKGRLVGVV